MVPTEIYVVTYTIFHVSWHAFPCAVLKSCECFYEFAFKILHVFFKFLCEWSPC